MAFSVVRVTTMYGVFIVLSADGWCLRDVSAAVDRLKGSRLWRRRHQGEKEID